LFAQTPDSLWTKTYGGTAWECGYSVRQTTDGGYIVAGNTRSYGAGMDDVYLIKTNSVGDTLWTRTYGGADIDEAYDVQQTSDGGYIIAGHTSSIGSRGMYLIKTDSIGDTLWTRPYPGPEPGALARSVQQTTDGGYVAVGSAPFFMDVEIHFVIADSTGDPTRIYFYGGVEYDFGNSVQQTSDGGFIIAGTTFSFGPNTPDASNVYLIKTDVVGDTLWTKTYGTTLHEQGLAIQQTTDGGYIISGTRLASNYECYLVKTDSLGDTLWTKSYPYGSGNSVQQTSDGGFIIAGTRDQDVGLIKTNMDGDTLWTRTFDTGDMDEGMSVRETLDGGYIISGLSWTSTGGADVYLVKTEPDTFGIEEDKAVDTNDNGLWSTIFSGPLLLPEGENCKVFDITGRTVVPKKIKPGIYFVYIDNKLSKKVIKVR